MSQLEPIRADVTLTDLQGYVKRMCDERGFLAQSVEREFLGLMEEVGELAEVIKNITKPTRNKNKEYDLGGELADVLLYVITIANTQNVNLAEVVEKKEAINRQRDWQK